MCRMERKKARKIHDIPNQKSHKHILRCQLPSIQYRCDSSSWKWDATPTAPAAMMIITERLGNGAINRKWKERTMMIMLKMERIIVSFLMFFHIYFFFIVEYAWPRRHATHIQIAAKYGINYIWRLSYHQRNQVYSELVHKHHEKKMILWNTQYTPFRH